MNKNFIIVLLLVAVVLSLPIYIFDRGILINIGSFILNRLFGTSLGEAIIRPNLTSMLCAIILMLPYMLKKKFFNFNNKQDIFICILDCMFVSSFLSCFFSSQVKDFFIIQFNPMLIVTIIAILLFVFPKKYIKIEYILILFIIFAIVRLSFVSHAMGIFGAIYVVCGIMAFIMQAKEFDKNINKNREEKIINNNITQIDNNLKKVNNKKLICPQCNTSNNSINSFCTNCHYKFK